jgi:hypothetical protein
MMKPSRDEAIATQSSDIHNLIETWIQTETQLSQNRDSPEIHHADPDYKLTRALLKDFDFKKAEALVLHSKPHPLQTLRTMIQRGNFKEASHVLLKLKGAINKSDSLPLVELCLEEARLTYHNANYIHCIEICDEALQLDPPSITLMSFLQVRSACHFELGEFEKSLSDVDTLESLSRIFPTAPVLIYGRVTRAKILARTRGLTVGQRELMTLWKKTDHNADTLLTLLRAEIDLRRLEQKSFFELAVACYWLAEKMGDRFFSALAFLDYYYSKKHSQRGSDQRMLESFTSEFPKIKQMRNEIEHGSNTQSTTTKTMNEAHPSHDQDWPLFDFNRLLIPKVELIAQVHESAVEIKYLPRRKQLFDAVCSLSLGDVHKENFFAMQWGKLRYVPFLHDGLIRTLICRIRKEMNLNIKSEDGILHMEDVHVVRL